MNLELEQATRKLRILLKGLEEEEIPQNKLKKEVLKKYQPVFSSENVQTITEEQFKEFLLIKNNKHWDGLHRRGGLACQNMQLLREALSILVDETKSIESRLNKLISKNHGPYVPNLGRAIITAILQVMFPDKYGVLNGKTEASMKELNIWPNFSRGSSFTERYLEINSVLNKLKEELNIDLWTLDVLWWRIALNEEKDGGKSETFSQSVAQQEDSDRMSFNLERQLHEFIRDNWINIELGFDWDIYEQDGEEMGYEYPTDIGRIDILAKHKKDPKWLIIELKRGQSSDVTIGQVLRYMGWVEEKLATEDEEVNGLIISHRSDEKIRFALKSTKNVSVAHYDVTFKLKDANLK